MTSDRKPGDLGRGFNPYLDPAVVEGMFTAPMLRPDELGYALVMVRGGTPEEVSGRMGRVVELGAAYGAQAHAMTSGLVVLSFGTLPSVAPGDRAALIAALLLELGADVKIVHGSAAGHHGRMGGPDQFAYGFILPLFNDALGRLSAMAYGDTEEYPPGNTE